MLNKEEFNYVLNALQDDQSDLAMSIKDKVKAVMVDDGVCLWKLKFDCGRQGCLTGIFKATKSEVDDIIDNYVYFGEVLGKHSEIYGTIEEHEIQLVSDDCVVVKNSVESGYNPFHYVRYECEECGDRYDSREDALNCDCIK